MPDGTTVLLDVEALDRGAEPRATFLLPFEPWQPLPCDARPRAVTRARWRRSVRRLLADATTSWLSLRTAATADLSLLPFQLEPALALLLGTASRFLIADAVGLGKTVQAGLMIAETLARFPGGRALVVAPAGLRGQWAEELESRFGLTPQLLDSGSIAGQALPEGANPWAAHAVVVTSIDYVKRADVIRGLETMVWDVMVFDEAHALAGRSDRAAAAAALARRARALVLLTATPHPGDEAAFQRLCALGALGLTSPPITFRRSREALGIRPTRRSRQLLVRTTGDEAGMHAALADYAVMAAAAGVPHGQLAVAVLRRRATSSAASLHASLERRIALLGAPPGSEPPVLAHPQPFLPFAGIDDDEPPEAELGLPSLDDRGEELLLLERLQDLARTAARCESKLSALRRLLKRVREPAIVFTAYRDTLATVSAFLGLPAAELHGGLSARERHEVVRRFTLGDVPLLLATDAASEGLNLHHCCRLVVHLELPCTPVRLEQRIGRVDRLGQRRTVHSIAMVAAGTSEMIVASRLAERQQAADAVAGDRPAAVSDAAAAEAARLEHTRGLLARGNSLPLDGRPIITVARRYRGRPLWAYRLATLGSDDCALWESLIAIATGTPATDPLIAAIATATHRLRGDMAPAIDSLEQRERAIAEALLGERARLSAGLMQPGLFDRRFERAASAQRLLLEEAETRCRARLDLLDRMRNARAVLGRLAFALRGR
jgi:superfamily II DNA or RNA helicase